MDKPHIKTAIPKRRYALGEFQAVLLGEIESGDSYRYVYILALVRDGEQEPELFVTSEKLPRSQQDQGSHRIRLVNANESRVLEDSDHYRELDAFADRALEVARESLNVTDENPVQLM